jgi:hypothetical protein
MRGHRPSRPPGPRLQVRPILRHLLWSRRRLRLRRSGRRFRVLPISGRRLWTRRRRRLRRSGRRFRVLPISGRRLWTRRRRRLRRSGGRFPARTSRRRLQARRHTGHRLRTRRNLRARLRTSRIRSQRRPCRGVIPARTVLRHHRRTCGGRSCHPRCWGSGSTRTTTPNRCPRSLDSAWAAPRPQMAPTMPRTPLLPLRFLPVPHRSFPRGRAPHRPAPEQREPRRHRALARSHRRCRPDHVQPDRPPSRPPVRRGRRGTPGRLTGAGSSRATALWSPHPRRRRRRPGKRNGPGGVTASPAC